MTTAELIRLLKKNGCELVGHHKRHDMYKINSTAKKIRVGRHAKEEVKSGTLHKILQNAGIE